MSGATVLRGLKKDELVDVAQASSLPNYESFKVSELRSALDPHLKANATTYNSSNNEHLKAYYEKEGLTYKSPAKRISEPVKKIAEKVSQAITSGDEAPIIKKRRKTTTAPTEESSSSLGALIKSPAQELRKAERRSSTILQQTSDAIAVSPSRVVAEFDNRITRPAQAYYSQTLERLHIAEYTDVVRDWASSPLAIAVLAIGFEFYGLRQELIPFKHLTNISLSRGTRQPVFVPDLFKLLELKFWGPFSLWLSTSLLVPVITAYFINVPLKTQATHTYGTRRATSHASTSLQYDPFVYFITKALISYLVYAEDTNILGVYSHYSVAEVKTNIPWSYPGILATSAIGASISLYEAALKK